MAKNTFYKNYKKKQEEAEKKTLSEEKKQQKKLENFKKNVQQKQNESIARTYNKNETQINADFRKQTQDQNKQVRNTNLLKAAYVKSKSDYENLIKKKKEENRQLAGSKAYTDEILNGKYNYLGVKQNNIGQIYDTKQEDETAHEKIQKNNREIKNYQDTVKAIDKYEKEEKLKAEQKANGPEYYLKKADALEKDNKKLSKKTDTNYLGIEKGKFGTIYTTTDKAINKSKVRENNKKIEEYRNIAADIKSDSIIEKMQEASEDKLITNLRDEYNYYTSGRDVIENYNLSRIWRNDKIDEYISKIKKQYDVDDRTAEKIVYKITEQEAQKTNNKILENNKQEYDSTGKKVGYSLASVGLNLVSSIPEFLDLSAQKIQNIFSEHKVPVRGDTLEITQFGQQIRDDLSETIDSDAGKFLYSTGMSMLDFAAVAALAGGLGAAATEGTAGVAGFQAALGSTVGEATVLGQFAASAAANTYSDMKEMGIDDNKAYAVAALAGLSEAVFEEISLDKLLKGFNTNSIRKIALNVVQQAGVEGSEEVSTDIANAITQRIILQDKNEYAQQYANYIKQGMTSDEAEKAVASNFGKQIALSFAGGALSGGIMSGATSTIGYFSNRGNVDSNVENNTNDEIHAEELIDSDVASEEIEQDNMQNQEQDDFENVYLDEEDDLEIAQALKNIQDENGDESGEISQAIERLLSKPKTTQIEDVEEKTQISTPETNSSRISENKVSNTSLPDAVKLNDVEIEESVNRGTYHPRFELNDRVTTERGTGYVQEIVRTGKDSRQALINYDDGTSEVVNMDVDHDYIDDGSRGLLYSFAVDFGYNGANTFINSADQSITSNVSNINKYANAARVMYDAGVQKISFDQAIKDNRTVMNNMTRNMAEEMYQAGVLDRKNNQALEFAQQAKIKKQEAIEKKTKVEQRRKEQKSNKSEFEYYLEREIKNIHNEKLSEKQKREVAAVEAVSEATGVKIKWFRGSVNERGQIESANGLYNPKTKEIWLDIEAGRTYHNFGETAIMNTLSHELTHYIEDMGGKLYKEYEAKVIELLVKETGKTKEELIRDKMNEFNLTSESQALSEIVAEGSEMMLKNTEAIKDLALNNKTLFEKIKAFIDKFVADIKEAIKNAYVNNVATSKEAKALEKYAEELQQLWDDALEYATENIKKDFSINTENSNNILKKDRKVTDSEGNELTKKQQKYFKDSKVRDEKGNLMVMYHGTPTGGFTVFKNGLQFFTNNKSYADIYQSPSASSRQAGKESTNPQTYEVYLNIKKPFDIKNPKTKELFINDYVKGGWALGINPYEEYKDTTKTGLPSWEEADNIYDWLEENDMLDEYDGIFVDEGGFFGEGDKVVDRGIAYVTFNSNQIKNITNGNPTDNEDIRFMMRQPNIMTVAEELGVSERFLSANLDGGSKESTLSLLKRNANVRRKFLSELGVKVEPVLKEVESNYIMNDLIKEFVKTNNISFETLEKNEKIRNDYANLIEHSNDEKERFFLQKVAKNRAEDFLEDFNAAQEGDEKAKNKIEREIQLAKGKAEAYDDGYALQRGQDKLLKENEKEFEKFILSKIAPIFNEVENIKREFEQNVIDNNDEYVKRAEKHYGITDDYSLAAYIDTNGKMIDFSSGGSIRGIDHRGIAEILDTPDGVSGTEALTAFMNAGNVRIMGTGIDISVKPNSKQKSVIRGFVDSRNGEIYIDFSKEDGSTDGSAHYSKGTSSGKIIADIDEYFRSGTLPENTYNSLSEFRFSKRQNVKTDEYYKKIKPATRIESEKLTMQDDRNIARYRNEIDSSFDGSMKTGQRILLGMPSKILLKNGIKNKPIYMSQDVAMKIVYPENYFKGKHNLGMSVLKNLPFQLCNPIIITKNTAKQNEQNESKVIWTNWKTEKGNSIMAVIRLNKNNEIEIDNSIPTIYDASEKYRKGILDNPENIIYTKNNKDINELLHRRRHMPKGITDDTLIKYNLAKSIDKVNNDPKVLFNLRNTNTELEEENTQLKEEIELKDKQIDLLKKQFEITKGHKPSDETLMKFAKKIQKVNKSSYPLKDLYYNIKQIVYATADTKFGNYSAVYDAFQIVAEEVLKQSNDFDMSTYNSNAELRDNLRKTRITLTDNQLEGIVDIYDDFTDKQREKIAKADNKKALRKQYALNNLRKSTMGRLNIVKEDGIQINEYWETLSKAYPEMFAREVDNDMDQLTALIDIAEEIRSPKAKLAAAGFNLNTREKLLGYNISTRKVELANEIMQEYFKLPTPQTFADKYLNLKKEYQSEFSKNLKETKEYNKQQARKKELRHQIVRMRNQIANKITNKKSVPFSMTDKIIDALNEIYRGKVNLASLERNSIESLKAISVDEEEAKKIANKASQLFLEDPQETQGRTEDRFEKWLWNEKEEGTLKFGGKLRDIANIIHDEFFNRAAVNKNEQSLHKKLKIIQEAYTKFRDANNVDFAYMDEYDERLNQQLQNIVEYTEDKTINDLDLYQLQEVYNSLKELSHMIVNATKMLDQQFGQEVVQVGENIMNQTKSDIKVNKKTGKRTANYAEKIVLNSIRYIRSITNYDSNNQLNKLYMNLFNAARKADKFVMDAKKPFDKLMDNRKEYNKFIGKDKSGLIKNAIYDKDHKPITLSHNMLCQILMTWDRYQGRMHMEHGGMVIYNIDELNKGNLEAANDKAQRTLPVTEKVINNLKQYVTKYDEKWMKEAKYLFNERSQTATNEVSMIVKGVPLAMANNYIHIYTNGDFVHKQGQKVQIDATLQGQGRLKETVSYAANPLDIMGLVNVVNDNINDTSKYYAFTIPIRNIRKAFNVQSPGGTESVRSVLREVYGTKNLKKLENIVDEIETGRAINYTTDDFQKKEGKWYSNFVASTLNTNLSVSIKQFASYPTALAYINAKNLTKALVTKVDLDEIDTHTGAHYKRRMGLSHVELEAIRKSSSLNELMDKLPTVLNGRKWIMAVDCFTTAKLWNAAKFQVNDEIKGTNIKEGSAEYWKKVEDLYHLTLEDTQPMYDVQYRTDLQKSNSQLARLFTMFKTQPLQTFGVLYDGINEARAKRETYQKYKTEANKKEYEQARRRALAGAVPSVVTSAALFTMLTLLANLALNKDKRWRDKETGELDILGNIPGEFVGSLISMLAPVGGNELYDILKALINGDILYDKESPTLSMLNEIISDFYNAWSYGKSIYNGDKEFVPGEMLSKAEKLTADILSAYGIEFQNVDNIIKAAIYHTAKLTGNKQLENSLGYQFEDSQLYQQIYNAILEGDGTKVDTLKEQLVSSGKKYSTIDNGIKNILIDKDERITEAATAFINKDYDTYEGLINDVKSDGFKSDVVIKAVEQVVTSLNPDEDTMDTDEDGKRLLYSGDDLKEAMYAGDIDSFNHIYDYLSNNGKDTNSLVKKALKDNWKEGSISTGQVSKYLKEYLGYSELDVYKTTNNWKNRSDYADLAEAIVNGDGDNISKYMELLYNKGKGYSVTSIKAGLSSQLKGQYVYEYYYGNEANLKNNLLYAADYLGVDINKYSATIDKWPSSAEDYNNMNYYIAAGDVTNAQNEIYDLHYNQEKDKSTILGSIEKTYKPLYVYYKNNNMDTSALEKTLLALAVYLGEDKSAYKQKIAEWK